MILFFEEILVFDDTIRTRVPWHACLFYFIAMAPDDYA
tara:strand:+ start:909 stop:1022 length:114 start_codon:yes stop_codon:yes gene_type:complete